MRGTRRRTVTGMALVAAVLAVAGCSAGDRHSAGSADRAAAPANAGQGDHAPAKRQPGEVAKDAAAPGDAGQGNQAATAQQLVDGRSIIFTGSVTVRVADVDDAAAKAAAIATTAGGFVGADKRTSDNRRSQATLTLRVPSARFSRAVDAVAALGRQESRDIDTQDVTDEVVDLDAKIASQQASVARTRALFNQARTISEIVSVEAELGKREAELATLQARKRKLDDLTTLSTITAILLGPEAAAPAKPTDGDKAGFLAGLRTGWHGLLGVLGVLLAVLGFLLPFVAVIGVPAGVAWWVYRSRRRRAAAASPAPAATPAPTELPTYPSGS
ncbi:MAG: DUF4349 domain-containing protein [Micromonosporaceae bacterium]|nr:DUF4349 domain-containing protein [Micromonosporaceae bacterium]